MWNVKIQDIEEK